jgi:hypothetical protein
MITNRRADRALGSSQIMSAISQPAKIALIAVGQNRPLTAWRSISWIAVRTLSLKRPSIANRRAKISVPRRLAARTTAQNLRRDSHVPQSRWTSKGSTAGCFR